MGSVLDRLLDIVGLLVVAGIGAWLSPLALDASSRSIFLSVIGLLTVVGAVGVGTLWFFPVRRLPFRLRRKLIQPRRALRATAGNRWALGAGFALGMLLQSLLVVLNWGLGIAIGIAIPLYVWFFVWPLAKISGLAPLTQGGIGVREAAQAALFAPFGVSAVKAVATGLVFEVVIIAGGLLGGAFAYVSGGLRNTRGGGAGTRPVGEAATHEIAELKQIGA